MSVEALKSASITNLDASPVIANTSGEGAPGIVFTVSDYVTISAAASQGSTYRVVRLASTVKVKEIVMDNDAMGAGKINLSVYYSDSTTDGTAVANQGVIVPTTGNQFFASDIDLSAASRGTDVTNQSGNYGVNKRNLPLWSALGLTADPGGWFDIVAVVHTTDITTGAGKVGLSVSFNG